jgi:hypothetical protein
MERNDIGVAYSFKHVIILEDTIMAPPAGSPAPPRRLRREAKRSRLVSEWVEQWELNRTMCQWIVWQATLGVQSEIWSFLPVDLYDPLSARVHQIAEDGILGWERWVDQRDALTRLRSDSTIDAVYDADPERIAMLWQMRGHAVLIGAAP